MSNLIFDIFEQISESEEIRKAIVNDDCIFEVGHHLHNLIQIANVNNVAYIRNRLTKKRFLFGVPYEIASINDNMLRVRRKDRTLIDSFAFQGYDDEKTKEITKTDTTKEDE